MIGAFLNKATNPSFWADDVYKAVSPLDLFNKDQRQKLTAFYSSNGLTTTASKMFDGFFAGKELPFGMASGGKTAEQVAKYRKTAAGVGAGLLAINAFAPDSLVDRAADLATGGILHGTIGRALQNLNKPLGMGYMGWAGINALRSGNNLGPM